jgi:hypothetical protein
MTGLGDSMSAKVRRGGMSGSKSARRRRRRRTGIGRGAEGDGGEVPIRGLALSAAKLRGVSRAYEPQQR